MASWPVVLAYVVLTTEPGGPELHWEETHPPYRFNDNGSADLGDEVFPALDRAFQSWNDASGVGYGFESCTNKGRRSVIDGDGDASGDGHSIITWIETSWPYSAATIAITWTYFGLEDGVIAEADMLMNGEDYEWSTSAAGGATDVEGVTAHEAGHYLGLGHTDVTAATMFPTVIQGDTQLRTLHADDIAGAQFLYGSGPSSGVSFSGECIGTDAADEGEGCACSLSSTGPRRGWITGMLTVFAFVGIVLARMRGAPSRAVAAYLAGLAMLALAGEAAATIMLDQSLEELTAASDSVIHGEVDSVEVETDGRTIRTVHRVRVLEVVAGAGEGEWVEVVTPGGVLPPGERLDNGANAMRAEGIPSFAPGEEVVVFAHRRTDGRLGVTGLQQGKLLVRRAPGGGATVERRMDGLMRVDKDARGLRAVTADPVSGLPLDEVLARVRTTPTRPAIR